MSTLDFIGFLFLSYLFFFKFLKVVITLFLNNYDTGESDRILKPNLNDFAVITGATDGIGLEYARQLADKRYNLLLLSQTQEKLQRVKEEMNGKYPQLKIEILVVDFSRSDIYEKIKQKLESLEGSVFVLVNNVGMSHSVPEYFANYPEGFNHRLINTNLLSMTLMTEMVIQRMLKQPFDPNEANAKRGVIINISSILSVTEFLMSSSYGAAKAYMNYLSKTIAAEYAEQHILVQVVIPNQVNTKMVRYVNNAWCGVSAYDFVRYALRSVGREAVTSAHPKHKLINGVLIMLNEWLPNGAFMYLKLKVARKIRANYEAKVQRDEEMAFSEIPLIDQH